MRVPPQEPQALDRAPPFDERALDWIATRLKRRDVRYMTANRRRREAQRRPCVDC